jgi:excisionase family DNA binding protein
MGLKDKKSVVQPVVSIPSSEPILTIEQVAERLQLKPSTVYELTRRRSRHPLPVLRAGKFLRFRWSEVERWLDESRGAG